MRLKILLCATLVLILVTGYSDAKIDPDRIVGIWLLDEGNGDVAEDVSGNEREGQSRKVTGRMASSMVPLKSKKAELSLFRLVQGLLRIR